jgi:long-subunit acyl-CoA synthetase (AMP-forming)
VIAIGDTRPYNVALITLDPDVAPAFAQQHGEEAVLAEVERGVAAANEQMARVEEIKRYKVLPTEWEPGGDELTPTMKLKRKPIHQKYEKEIESLYG